MKSAIASLLVLGALPQGTLAFTSRALTGNPVGVARAAETMTPRHLPSTTRLHGLLPGFLKRDGKTSDATTEDEGGADVGEAMISPQVTNSASEVEEEEEELSETKKMLQKVKQAGTAGAISYALWELGFWGVSLPVCVVGYRELTGHWPDLTNSEDMQKVGAEAFAFVNFARLAVPLRIGLALSTTSWIDENVVQKFMKKDEAEGESEV